MFFEIFFFKKVIESFSFLGKSHRENEKWPAIAEVYKLGVSFKMGLNESKLSFLRFSLRFCSALAIFEPEFYLVVEQFGAENISLLSGLLV